MTTLVKSRVRPLGITILPRVLVNILSLSRIVLGLAFLICFRQDAVLLYISITICFVALITDILDGYLARRLGIDSITGRLWDSLGDKSFYAAIIIAYNAQGFLAPIVSWGLIVREVALYITRTLYVENLPKIEQIRPSTNLHGYLMYVIIVLGMVRMFGSIYGLGYVSSPYIHLSMQLSGFLALMSGLYSIFHYIKLK